MPVYYKKAEMVICTFYTKEYVQLLNKKRKTFAREINMNETELSQLINDHRLRVKKCVICGNIYPGFWPVILPPYCS